MSEFDDTYRAWMQEEEQREAMIKALIADDIEKLKANTLPLADILRGGFSGYDHVSDVELLDEFKTRGLTL